MTFGRRPTEAPPSQSATRRRPSAFRSAPPGEEEATPDILPPAENRRDSATSLFENLKQFVGRLAARISGIPGAAVPALATEGGATGLLNDLPPIDTRKIAYAGYVIIFVFFGGLGGWAALAPLESAAVAPGVVGVETKRKTMQHLEGGIVSKIYVQDGDEVKRAQVLVRLDETQPKANLDLLRGNYWSLSALEARLIAERDGKDEIRYPDWLSSRMSEPAIAEILEGQINIFVTRRKAVVGQIDILKQGVAQYIEEIHGLEGQIVSENRQLSLLDDELKGIQILLDKGLARRPRLLGLQRQKAEVQGQRSQNLARIARVKQSIAETELRMSEVRTKMINEVVEKLREVQSERVDIAERSRAAEDVLTRMTIRAPMDGTVVDLKIHTVGGVISPGEPLMDIVPSDDQLVVEAQVDPNDIEVVYPGLLARVRLSAFSQRTTRPIEGQVVSVSADRLINQNTGQPYYTVVVKLTEDPRDVLNGAPLHPGMSAEVMLITGKGTALDYMLAPVLRTFERSFREN